MSPSDYEMVEQGYDPPRMRVEEIVERCETYQYSLPRDEQRALIASWRERGALLREALPFLSVLPESPLRARIDAALAAEPASGEATPFVFDTGEEPAVRIARRQRMEADDVPPTQGDVEA